MHTLGEAMEATNPESNVWWVVGAAVVAVVVLGEAVRLLFWFVDWMRGKRGSKEELVTEARMQDLVATVTKQFTPHDPALVYVTKAELTTQLRELKTDLEGRMNELKLEYGSLERNTRESLHKIRDAFAPLTPAMAVIQSKVEGLSNGQEKLEAALLENTKTLTRMAANVDTIKANIVIRNLPNGGPEKE